MATTALEAAHDNKWIQTAGGRPFWPLNPREQDVSIEDIAHALSMKCRYTGHCLDFYSVAQHSVIVSRIVPPKDALWGLMHDATEAYLPDVARPVKKALAGFCEIEDRLMACIARALKLTGGIPTSVHRADLVMLATESRDLMAPPPFVWTSLEGIEPQPDRIFAMTQTEARRAFLDRFAELW